MTEAFMTIGLLGGVMLVSVFLTVGFSNVFDPWDKKERDWGIVKLIVGGLLLLSIVGFAVAKGVEQDELKVRCISYGGVSYNNACYKDGTKVGLDEEGQD